MEKIRTAIIGTGGIGEYHARGYEASAAKGECELVACCDLDREKALAFAEKHNIPKKAVYTDYKKMIQREQLDAVSVTTWNAAHMSPTLYALNHGLNVICEKPMAMNAAQARRMLEASEKNGKKLQIGFCRRFGADAVLAKKLVDAGAIGDIYYAKAVYMRQRGCPGGWFADKAYSGGGPLIDLGVHVIDLARYLAGCPKPVEVFGATFSGLLDEPAPDPEWKPTSGKRVFKHDVEDLTAAFIRFDNGMVLNLEASFNLNLVDGGRNIVELFGKKNGVSLSPVKIAYPLDPACGAEMPEEPQKADFGNLFDEEICDFVRCVRTGDPVRADGNDGLAVMKIIDAIYRSAETGKSVSIR